MRRTNRTALISGIVFIVLGLIFLGEDLGLLDVAADLIIPVLLLALGVGIILGVRRSDYPSPRSEPPPQRTPEPEPKPDPDPKPEPEPERRPSSTDDDSSD